MNNDLRTQIYNNMKLKDTEELLNIWSINNRTVWSNQAIEVIEEILRERNVEVPTRDEPIHDEIEEEGDEDIEYNPNEFTEEERKIIEDKYPPEFYDPFEVLTTSRRLKWAAWAIVAFYTVTELLRYKSIKASVDEYFTAAIFQTSSFRLFETVVIWIELIALIVVNSLVLYFMLIGLSHVLKILMEMEFNSRK